MKALLTFLCIFSSADVLAQRTAPVSLQRVVPAQRESVADSGSQKYDIQMVFDDIEKKIASGTVSALAEYFGSQLYVSISGGESGYFSANQAVSLLQNYFMTRKPVAFSFSRQGQMGGLPYATGRLQFVQRGNRESIQVYVALARQDAGWTISQFNLY